MHEDVSPIDQCHERGVVFRLLEIEDYALPVAVQIGEDGAHARRPLGADMAHGIAAWFCRLDDLGAGVARLRREAS